ncbi:MAG: endonuclease/exonuclease/phosphatase family protein [Chloroflexota bacterium]
MLSRLRSLFLSQPLLLYSVEASLVGLFFIQSLRYLIGGLYARIGSASLYPALNPAQIDPMLPGLVEPSTVSGELALLGYILLLPLLAVFFGRYRVLLLVATGVAALGRYLMLGGTLAPDITGAMIAVGGGLLYVAMMVRHRATLLPFMMILGLTLDQLFRAAGDTFDPTWSGNFQDTQLILSGVTVGLALINLWLQSNAAKQDVVDSEISPDRGLMPIWGGIGFGALLFLELAMLSTANVVARRAGVSYVPTVPLLVAATLLPLVPVVRQSARRFVGLFDSGLRGWAWMMLVMLLIVLGVRLSGIVAVAALGGAQFAISMMWWWLYRPQAASDRNLTGLWLIPGVLIFGLLVVFDVFTYEYAFVRDFSEAFDFLNPIVPPLLRGFRGLGLAVLLLAVFFAVMPMAQTQRRIPWGGSGRLSFLMVPLIALTSGYAAFLARPPIVPGVINPELIRLGTYNIHGGFNEFFHYDLRLMARTIEFSGANIVLLQEVEAGRLTSYGVDQPLWLARQLGMDVRFYPTNEDLQGLALLSDIEIVFDDGVLLESRGTQTGLQRVQVRPSATENVITVYNTWLEPLLDTGGALSVEEMQVSQNEQLTDILTTIARHHPDGRLGRMIIGGTFNNVPDSDVIRRLLEVGFDDPFSERPPELVVTFQRTGVRARLDYIWTSSAANFQVVEADVINDRTRENIPRQASDHLLPLIGIRLR